MTQKLWTKNNGIKISFSFWSFQPLLFTWRQKKKVMKKAKITITEAVVFGLSIEKPTKSIGTDLHFSNKCLIKR